MDHCECKACLVYILNSRNAWHLNSRQGSLNFLQHCGCPIPSHCGYPILSHCGTPSSHTVGTPFSNTLWVPHSLLALLTHEEALCCVSFTPSGTPSASSLHPHPAQLLPLGSDSRMLSQRCGASESSVPQPQSLPCLHITALGPSLRTPQAPLSVVMPASQTDLTLFLSSILFLLRQQG